MKPDKREIFGVVRSVVCSPQVCDDEHAKDCSCLKIADEVCKFLALRALDKR